MKVLAEKYECNCMQHSYVYVTEDFLLLGHTFLRSIAVYLCLQISEYNSVKLSYTSTMYSVRRTAKLN